jgi:hypothetical protein
MENDKSQKEWYRHPWPWVLILIPFSAVVFGIFMVVISSMHPDDLVVDNYYKDGMAINQSLEMDHRASDLGITARQVPASDDRIAFEVRNATDTVIVLYFYHVTDRAQDTSLVLYPGDDGIYESSDPVPISLGEKGIWYLEMRGSEEGWRLRSRVVTPAKAMELTANE